MLSRKRMAEIAASAPASAPTRKRARVESAIDLDSSGDEDIRVVSVKRPSSPSIQARTRVVIDLDVEEGSPDWLPSSEAFVPVAGSSRSPKRGCDRSPPFAPVAGPSRRRQRDPSPILDPVDRLLKIFPDLDREHAVALLAEPRFVVAESPTDAVANHLFGLGGEVRTAARSRPYPLTSAVSEGARPCAGHRRTSSSCRRAGRRRGRAGPQAASHQLRGV